MNVCLLVFDVLPCLTSNRRLIYHFTRDPCETTIKNNLKCDNNGQTSHTRPFDPKTYL